MGVVNNDRGGEGERPSQAGGTAGAAAPEATEGMGCHGGDRCQDVEWWILWRVLATVQVAITDQISWPTIVRGLWVSAKHQTRVFGTKRVL